MPVLILSIAKNLDKLFENGVVTPMASLCKSSRVVVMAIDVSIMLIVTVLRAEYCRTYRACEVFNVIFPI